MANIQYQYSRLHMDDLPAAIEDLNQRNEQLRHGLLDSEVARAPQWRMVHFQRTGAMIDVVLELSV